MEHAMRGTDLAYADVFVVDHCHLPLPLLRPYYRVRRVRVSALAQHRVCKCQYCKSHSRCITRYVRTVLRIGAAQTINPKPLTLNHKLLVLNP
eukprot:1110923-Rhodomonas_salina.1